MMNRDRLLALFLRAAGSVTALAFASVVMPRAWMEASHEWLGMGSMPRGAVVDYMIRQASTVYGLQGIALWLLASDVERYRPLIRFTGWSFLLVSPIFVAIDSVAGMPWFWILGDGVCCAGLGAIVLWLSARGNVGHVSNVPDS
jgi:hypothetical protein